MRKSLEYYYGLPYTIEFEMAHDDHDQPFWAAEIREFDGCVGVGNTQTAAANNLWEVFDDYVNKFIELGIQIPEPTPPSSIDVVAEPYRDQFDPTRIVGALNGKPKGAYRASKPISMPSNTHDRQYWLSTQ